MKNEEIILSELEDIKKYLTSIQDNLNLFSDCLMSFLYRRSKTNIISKSQKMMAKDLASSVEQAIEENSVTPSDVKDIADGLVSAANLRIRKGKIIAKTKKAKK